MFLELLAAIGKGIEISPQRRKLGALSVVLNLQSDPCEKTNLTICRMRKNLKWLD